MKPTACPTREELSAYLLGKLPEDAAQHVADHSGRCASCQKALQVLDGVTDPLVAQLRQKPAPVPELGPVLQKAVALGAKALAAGPRTQADAATTPPDNTLSPPGEATQSLTAILAPSQHPGEIGRLGSYSVLKVLGQGGMGVVFQAEDPQLKRPVALKAMLPDVAAKAAARERFLREARAAAAIEHDHIVTIYQVGEDRGVPFLAMQFLKGMSLEDFMKKQKAANKPLTWGQILKLGREIAKGLGAAHERGLIHRDIKPANIWLDATAGGRVKILDFGLARGAEDAQLTQSGMIVGTAAYMAPEQAKSLKVDGRADLYSLGCVLYRLCTGRTPFIGPDAMAVLIAAATEEPPPVQELNKDTPPDLAALTMKLLAKKPEDRVKSAQEVVKTISAIERKLAPRKEEDDTVAQERITTVPRPAAKRGAAAASETQPQIALPRRSRKRWAVAAAAALTLSAAAVLALVVLRKDDDPSQARVTTGLGTGSGRATGPEVAIVPPVANAEVDLLKLIDRAKNAPAWRFQDQTLVTPGRGGYDRLQIPYTPPAEYELEIDATRMNGNSTLVLGLLGGGRPFHLMLDHINSSTSGLANMDGKKGTLNESTHRGGVFTNEKLSRITVRVTRQGVTIHCDGKKIIDWQGDYNRLTPDSSWAAPNPQQLSVGVFNSSFHIQKLALRPLPGGSTSPALDQWVREVQKLPAEEQVKAVAAKLQELNPKFDGKVERDMKPGWFKVKIVADDLVDIAPLRGLTRFQALDLVGRNNEAALPDLDLLALANTSFAHLDISRTRASDLTPLRTMPNLRVLSCSHTRVSDLTPLHGLRLTGLYCAVTRIKDLAPLRGMSLDLLSVGGSPVTDLTPLRGMPLQSLGANVETLSKNLEVLRSLWALAKIRDEPAADFWKKHDPKHAALLQWIEDTKKLAGKAQGDAVAAKLKERNPEFEGTIDSQVTAGLVKRVNLLGNNLTDLAPVRALGDLHWLDVRGTEARAGKLTDLFPLAGLAIRNLDVSNCQVADLTPLRNLPAVVHFNCAGTLVDDLTPLVGKQLFYLNIGGTRVRDLRLLPDMKIEHLSLVGLGRMDLSPLGSMALNSVAFDLRPESDIAPLKKLWAATKINGELPIDFWKQRDPTHAAFLRWIEDTKKLQPEEQVTAVKAKLKDRNPGYDGIAKHKIAGGVVVLFDYDSEHVTDIAPVRALAQLEQLKCVGPWGSKRGLADLTPLAGMKLKELTCQGTMVSDLTPLRGLPLTYLNAASTPVADLTPLVGMRLSQLTIHKTGVTDLAPLKGMTTLSYLRIEQTQIKDLSSVQELSLTSLSCAQTPIVDLTPVRNMPLQAISANQDLLVRSAAMLRGIMTLETINSQPAAKFWKEMDAKKP